MASKLVFGRSAEAPGTAARRRKHETADRAPIAGPKPDENTTTNAERELRARMLDYEARLWKDGNPDADTYITSRALQEARAGRRFGMKQLMEEARRKDFADTKGARTKINNTLSPALARILIEEHPEIRRFMETRHSVVDEAGI